MVSVRPRRPWQRLRSIHEQSPRARARRAGDGKGRYSIYQTPGGDGVISYRPDGADADAHQVVPAKFWTVLMGILSGEVKDLNPLTLVKMLMGGK